MNQQIEDGDLVIFNPKDKLFFAGPKFLRSMRDHVAVVLRSRSDLDEYIISFEPGAQALVSLELIEKISPEPGFDIVESWFQKFEQK